MQTKKIENPEWKQVVIVKYHAGMTGNASKIVQKYFKAASEKAGTPIPMEISMRTGEYDVILVWAMKDGLEEMNWESSPDNVKWWNALAEMTGGMDKAKEKWDEYLAMVDYSTSAIRMAR
jgi:hypothetical protein